MDDRVSTTGAIYRRVRPPLQTEAASTSQMFEVLLEEDQDVIWEYDFGLYGRRVCGYLIVSKGKD